MWGQIVMVLLAGSTVFAKEPATFAELLPERSDQRITHGWFAVEGQIPHQLAIRAVDRAGIVSGCGACLVHHEWAITAAHCIDTHETVVVRTGTLNLTRPEYIFETTEFYHHPWYDAELDVVQPHDIGIIKFNRYLEYNSLTQPIRIQRHADRNKNYEDIKMTVSGWGRIWTNAYMIEHLMYVYMRGVTNEECHDAFGDLVVDSTICANGYDAHTQSPCQGDSGGPLSIVDKDGKLTLVGIAAFVSGRGCHVELPAGFIRPGHYHEWFTQITGINFDWEYDEDIPESAEEQAPEYRHDIRV